MALKGQLCFSDKLIKEENTLYSDIINTMSGSQPSKQKKRIIIKSKITKFN